jgi:2-polyprenyl-3-methyl-5-hydroxy-6-metoxy-1,4-benzoquinol methylase
MSVMTLAWKVYFSLPPVFRKNLRTVLKRGAGHGSSKFNKVIAIRDAQGKCRIDRTADMFCEGLVAAGMAGLESKRCLEIGTGYVGSVAVVMWLLGAKSVTTVDLNPLLVVEALKEAIHPVKKDDLINRLQKHVNSEQSLVQRVNDLYLWASHDGDNVSRFFSYQSPFDILSNEQESQFDFIYSVSTLEHIPKSLVERFLEKMASQLSNGGVELHSIDLADHLDIKENPLRFLGAGNEQYSDDSEADSRGNRIRASEWLTLFKRGGLNAVIAHSSSVTPDLLPKQLASPFKEMDVDDLLRTSIVLRACHVPSK